MVQVPILAGYAASSDGFAQSVPVNLTPVPTLSAEGGSGISKGYLRTADGVAKRFDTARDRSGYVYVGNHYRVLGDTLYLVGDTLTAIGNVGSDNNPVMWAESLDRLAIGSAGNLYYLQGMTLTKVTDPDLGLVLGLTWSDGYFITTDGTYIIVTELNDPTKVDPLKYGSSEADPDPIVGVLAQRGQVYAINRYSIEVFINGGTTGFPFQRNRGSQVPSGCVGPDAFTPFADTFAFVGSARGEAVAVHLAGPGQAVPISTREVGDALAELTDAQLASIECEAVTVSGSARLLVHLPAMTWVYHATASQAFGVPVWSKLAGGVLADQPYPARHFTLAKGQWWCGSATAIGVVSDDPALFGQEVGFQCDTPLIYNGGTGALVHELELVTLGQSTTAVSLSWTDDGRTYSQARLCPVGNAGAARQRTSWRRCGRLRHWRGFRLTGVAHAAAAFARLEADLEPLV